MNVGMSACFPDPGVQRTYPDNPLFRYDGNPRYAYYSRNYLKNRKISIKQAVMRG